jgi:hypothetical protein
MNYTIETTGNTGWLAYRYQYKTASNEYFGYAETEQRSGKGLINRGHGFVVTLEEIGNDLDLPNVTVVIFCAMNSGCEGGVKHEINLARNAPTQRNSTRSVEPDSPRCKLHIPGATLFSHDVPRPGSR